MKKHKFRRILPLTLCLFLLAGVFPLSVFAAKEMFYDIKTITLNITAPEADTLPDFEGSDPSGLYSIDSVKWIEYTGTADNYKLVKILKEYEYFEYSKKYVAIFSLSTTSELYSFNTAATATVNELTAVVEYESSSSVTVAMFFPETEPFFKTLTQVDIMDVTPPMAGESPVFACQGGPKEWQPVRFEWTDSAGNYLTKDDVFEEGEKYSFFVYLEANLQWGEFAVDYNHPLAFSGYPFTAVTATINGSSDGVLVLPNNTDGTARTHITVGKSFECVPSNKITNVSIKGVFPPIAGQTPGYAATLGSDTYELWNHTNTWYNVGVAWRNGKDELIPKYGSKFEGSTAYTLEVILTPAEGYEFKKDKNGNPQVTATVLGALAEVEAHGEENIVVRYTFEKTENVVLSKVVIKNLAAPEVGKEPDYEITLGSEKYSVIGFENTDEPMVNGIVWINEDTKAPVIPGQDRFMGGYTYSVTFMIQTKYPYVFKLKDGELSTTVTINGKEAEILSYTDTQLKVFYRFEALPNTEILGDINGDGVVNLEDSLTLFRHSMMPEMYPVSYTGTMDFNKDGFVDLGDSMRLFQYSMMPDLYPLN